ncbi:MAG: enolase C-terminal domain-like protein [Pseudomonadota bacterium]
MGNKIVSLSTVDVRFPTSEALDGSDALNKDPDYSAAYVTLTTELGDQGYGLVFTIGRGNELCCQAIEAMQHLVVGHDLDDIKSNMGEFYRQLQSDSQIRWLGPEKGVVHMAAGSIANAVWDLWARSEQKPVWRLLADMSPETFVDCVDLRYVSDALTRDEALGIVNRGAATRDERIRYLEQHGYPAYTTSAGWLGYSDAKLERLCRHAVGEGFGHVKLKVGLNVEDDVRRCRIARETIGDSVKLMVDANQVWEVGEAIEWMQHLTPFKPWFIEEPTNPDDVLGHKKIREALNDVQVATGEHCQNRVLFKQFIASDAIDVVQIDACRLAGLNEILTVYLIAAKFGKPVCPHAGGVGLCEYVQHMSMIDFVMISGEIGDRVIEYVDHLHEHFEDPVRMLNGAYQVPRRPGFSIKMNPESLQHYEFPDGAAWRARTAEGARVKAI